MSNLKRSLKGYRIPTAVCLFGIFSVALLVWVSHINNRQQINFLAVAALMDAQTNVASGHLWLEESLSGEATAEKALSELDQAIYLVDAALNGGKSEHGVLIPQKDPVLRSRLAEIKAMIVQFKILALKRLRNSVKAGIGTGYDQQFDALFEDILVKGGTWKKLSN